MEEVQTSGSSAFGTLLREYRLAAGLSQEALAERARMSSHGVSALERGYRRTPQRETLALLVGALSLDDEQRRAFERAAARTGLIRRGVVAAAPPPWPSGSTSALPLALTSFVGRETELEEITALVREHRLVTITGSGGVGKTQTALHVGSALAEGTNGAVCFAGLAPITDPSFVVSTIAAAIGVQPTPNQAPMQSLLGYLQTRPLLLILDNCEQVVSEAAKVTGTLLASCPQVRILATSREPLKVAGEFTYRLPSLNLPAAVGLFADRAGASDHTFTLNENTVPAVSELCAHLDGIPLAIELAAARVSFLSLKAITEGLGDRFRMLAGGDRTALARQQTMRAAIDWSYDLLSEPERRLFERMSIFAGSCTLETVAALYEGDGASKYDVLEWLSSLVDKSLVIADFEGDEARYRLLESSREYGREKLSARGEEQTILRRYLVALLDVAERVDKAVRSEGYAVWRPLLRDMDNWRVALKFALSDRFDVLSGQRFASLLPVGFIPVEGRQWVRLALELVDEKTPPRVVARLRFAESMCAFALREFAETVSSCQIAINLYTELGDALRVAFAQDRAGHALTSLGRIAEGKALIEAALASARVLGDRRLLAWTLRCLGYATAKGGDLVRARAYLAEALPTYREHFYAGDLAFAINDLSVYEFCAGNVEAAISHATEMLAVCRETNIGARSIATALNAMSVYLAASGRYDEAEERAREALDLAREHHMDVFVAYALQSLAAVTALRPPPAQIEGLSEHAYRHAARLLGCVDRRLASLGSSRPMAQERQYERVVAALTEALGKETLAELKAAGATMTQDEAIASVLDA
jgi:predicted ATPase/transcriptional regulator with XRE-family HTH domain/tetratricopeptide (TPR) repeat protein